MKYLLNSAVLAAGAYGTYEFAPASVDDLAGFLSGEFRSGIGYPETADLIREWSGTVVPLSRETFSMEPGDEAMIVRLRYRVVNPATKGQPVSRDPADWEIARLKRLS